MDATVAVTEVNSVGPNTVAIVLESPDGFDARPGQFVKLSATVDDEDYARFYTLSSPDAHDTFEITVGVDPEEAGPFSQHLLDLEAGDELDISGPFGNEYYEDESTIVVLAGGPGVGAAVGLAERALRDGGSVALVYKDDAPAHEERLADLRERGATVVVTDGDLADHVDDVHDDDAQVFVYGFADFVQEAADAVDAAGGDPADAKVENFG
ncbi:oxidoreductase [Haloprofundus marisrubri]|uniref:Oxidoreductase n=1 Tax=Haloprofundus marisrubri TaxID=1514971 RepID=A0A0W1R8J9_9EURY|nr:FAD-dependent oxidoreductase [Haloprofundus marisrubri]KTG09849.1 oxidoreductase [Haloprofundus marisrubri]